MTAFSIELHHPMPKSGRVAEIRPAPVTGVVKPHRAGRAVGTTWTSFGYNKMIETKNRKGKRSIFVYGKKK